MEREDARGIQWVETSEAADPPTGHTKPPPENYSAQNVTAAVAEKSRVQTLLQ